MGMNRQLVDAPDDGYWQSLLHDAEQTEDPIAHLQPAPAGAQPPLTAAGDPAPTQVAQWQWAQDVFTRDETLEGIVTGFNRGGLLVRVRDMAGFIPASHMVGL